MRFASALTTVREPVAASTDLVRQIRSELGPVKLDLAFVFAHPGYLTDDFTFWSALRQGLGSRHVIGCSGAGIIGDREECEEQPAVAVLAGELPGVSIQSFHITAEELEEAGSPDYWHFQLEVTPDVEPKFVLLADPFSVPATNLVQELGEAFPGAPIVGGLASGGRPAGATRLLLDDELVEGGAVGVALAGPVMLRTVVSQGCRPIGQPFTITRAEKNIIFELAGRPPLAVLQEMLPQLAATDQQLARTALFLGRVINEYQEDFGRGDFLVRNLIGHDPNSGALALGDWIRPGQTVQFQVRDGTSAAEDLQELLRRQQQWTAQEPVRGALLFSCLGRGAGMYGVQNHDINALQSALGPMPAAGFFANGEIGPVGAVPFIHGFTSVIGLFAEPVTQ
jgi:small ligand-binding sensory domain FIST